MMSSKMRDEDIYESIFDDYLSMHRRVELISIRLIISNWGGSTLSIVEKSRAPRTVHLLFGACSPSRRAAQCACMRSPGWYPPLARAAAG